MMLDSTGPGWSQCKTWPLDPVIDLPEPLPLEKIQCFHVSPPTKKIIHDHPWSSSMTTRPHFIFFEILQHTVLILTTRSRPYAPLRAPLHPTLMPYHPSEGRETHSLQKTNLQINLKRLYQSGCMSWGCLPIWKYFLARTNLKMSWNNHSLFENQWLENIFEKILHQTHIWK